MKWMKIWLWVFLVLIPWLAKAQDTLTASDSKAIKFSLKEAQEYALQNSPAVKSAAIDLESCKEKNLGNYSHWPPPGYSNRKLSIHF